MLHVPQIIALISLAVVATTLLMIATRLTLLRGLASLAAVVAFVPSPSFAELEGTKVRIFLCDTEKAALTFAVARSSPQVTDDMASDIVNKDEKRNACNRYIGYVGKETEHRRMVQGLFFKVTRYRLHFADNRGASDAWGAERIFDASPKGITQDL